MRRIALTLIVSITLLVCAIPAFAADSWHELSASNAISSALGQEKLDKDIRVFMKGQSHPAVTKKFGEYKSNQRANKFGKSIETACDTAFLSALIALQQRAVREGGNAVIDVYTITKNQQYESPENFKCIAGGFVANVALMGTVVTLAH